MEAEPGAQPPSLRPRARRLGVAAPLVHRDVGEEGGDGQRGPGLETSESLSDSLYDSLSSCRESGLSGVKAEWRRHTSSLEAETRIGRPSSSPAPGAPP